MAKSLNWYSSAGNITQNTYNVKVKFNGLSRILHTWCKNNNWSTDILTYIKMFHFQYISYFVMFKIQQIELIFYVTSSNHELFYKFI